MSLLHPQCSPATLGRRPYPSLAEKALIPTEDRHSHLHRSVRTQADKPEPVRSYSENAKGGLRWRPPLRGCSGGGDSISLHHHEQLFSSNSGSHIGLRAPQPLRGPQPSGGLGWWGDSTSTNGSAAPSSKSGPVRADSGKSVLPYEATYAGGGGSTGNRLISCGAIVFEQPRSP